MNEQDVPSTELIRGVMLAIGPKSLEAFDRWLAEHDRGIWHDGFIACAEWWEIHHAEHIADEQNPYRE